MSKGEGYLNFREAETVSVITASSVVIWASRATCPVLTKILGTEMYDQRSCQFHLSRCFCLRAVICNFNSCQSQYGSGPCAQLRGNSLRNAL